MLCSSALVSTGCKDESFNPKGEFKEKYILNCILRSDTTVQFATISRSYNVQGYDPGENKTDPALDNADVRIWVGDSVYILKPGEMPRQDAFRYTTPVKYFYADYLKLKADRPAEIMAVLPNGRKLHAVTRIPRPAEIDYVSPADVIPPSGRDYIMAQWMDSSDPNTFFCPRFSLIYLKIENGVPVRYTKRLPVRYVKSGDKFIPVYAAPTNVASCRIEMDAINRTMKDLAAEGENKENYIVLSVIAEVMTLDKSLSAYYSSSKLFDDGLSVKLDQTDFTNIEGGLGVFGSFVITKFSILMDKAYINSFGYKSRLLPE